MSSYQLSGDLLKGFQLSCEHLLASPELPDTVLQLTNSLL